MTIFNGKNTVDVYSFFGGSFGGGFGSGLGGLFSGSSSSIFSSGSLGGGHSGSNSGIGGALSNTIGDIAGSLVPDSIICEDGDPTHSRKMQRTQREFLKGTDSIIGEIIRTEDDLKGELHELLTIGAFEMLVKGNDNYKTSYEIKEEALKRKQEANFLFHNTEETFLKLQKEVNQKIGQLRERKLLIAQKLSTKLEKVVYFNANVISPEYNGRSYYQKDAFGRIKGGEHFGIRDHLNNMEYAKDYAADAEDYVVEIEAKIAAMNRSMVFLKSVLRQLEEEEHILDMLETTVTKAQECPSDDLIPKLNILIEENIIKSDHEWNVRYLEILNAIKDMCS